MARKTQAAKSPKTTEPVDSPEAVAAAIQDDDLTKREQNLNELAEYLDVKTATLETLESDLAAKEKDLLEMAAQLKEAEEQILTLQVEVDEQYQVVKESQGKPAGKVRALRVLSRVAPGFYRGGISFSVSKPVILSMAELTIEQRRAITSEPNLRVEEILV